MILRIPGLPSRKLNSKSFLVRSKSQPSIFAFPSVSETAHIIRRNAVEGMCQTPVTVMENQRQIKRLCQGMQSPCISPVFIWRWDKTCSVVQLIPILSGQGFLISFLETLIFRFQSHRDYFHLQSTFLVMSRAGRGLETHREKVCLISDMEIPSLRVK